MLSIKGVNSFLLRYEYLYDIYESILSCRQILGTGNLPEDSAPVCINIDEYLYDIYESILSRQQILGTGNLPQDSAPVCINIDGAPTKPSILCHRS